jgi:hypothetical protein
MPRAPQVSFDVRPYSVVGIVSRSEIFECARGEDGGALETHDFTQAVDKDAAVEGVREEIGVDEG